jgi:hypothetical protein
VIEVTVNEILDVLQQHSGRPESGEGVRVEELEEATGISQARLRKMLKAAMKQGKVKTTRRTFTRMDGQSTTVAAYAIVSPTRRTRK